MEESRSFRRRPEASAVGSGRAERLAGAIQPSRLDGRRVLVLEEEFFATDELAHVLGAAGAIVVGPFTSIEAALAVVQGGGEVHLAVLDIGRQGCWSHPVAAALKARGVPVVFLPSGGSRQFRSGRAASARFAEAFDARRLLEQLPDSGISG